MLSKGAKEKDDELSKLKASSADTAKEMKKIQEKLKAVESAGKLAGKSNKDKDKIIAVSYLECFISDNPTAILKQDMEFWSCIKGSESFVAVPCLSTYRVSQKKTQHVWHTVT